MLLKVLKITWLTVLLIIVFSIIPTSVFSSPQNAIYFIGFICIFIICYWTYRQYMISYKHPIIQINLPKLNTSEAENEPVAIISPRPNIMLTNYKSIQLSHVVQLFLEVFKHQQGVAQHVPAYINCTKNVPDGISIYELKIQNQNKLISRYMSIGQLGESSTSKSKCFYVIYDDHMVVKIPPYPINNFVDYIRAIKADKRIIDKLSPKECIVPMVKPIMSKIHRLDVEDTIPKTQLEEKYISWLEISPKFFRFLQIEGGFVFFMDLSKYYFLSHVTKDIHHLESYFEQEIKLHPFFDMELYDFEGRYGHDHTSLYLEIKNIFNEFTKELDIILVQCDIFYSPPLYLLKEWFFCFIHKTDIQQNNSDFPPKFYTKLKLLFHDLGKDHKKTLELYKKMLMDFVQRTAFERTKIQITNLIVNLLDLLAWLRVKYIAIRDLKPDNLFVAGDPANYPIFLNSSEAYTIGLIDVETAVDFEAIEHHNIAQPQLGGTPNYALPVNLIKNEVIQTLYNRIPRILHLQDWYACIGIIFNIATGYTLFKQTANLLPSLNMNLKNVPEGNLIGYLKKEIQKFWDSASNEINVNLSLYEKQLKSMTIRVPDKLKLVFRQDILLDINHVKEKIDNLFINQSLIKKLKTIEEFKQASHQQIDQIRHNWMQKLTEPNDPTGKMTTIINFLTVLSQLKLQYHQLSLFLEILHNKTTNITTYDVLHHMFNVVYAVMYCPEWLIEQKHSIPDLPPLQSQAHGIEKTVDQFEDESNDVTIEQQLEQTLEQTIDA
ncbi:MAG: hypothetical protein HQK77_06415 [Desulfobacterales bacterium]|nr:hypothetical protein [Desulfobacterales bacterium]